MGCTEERPNPPYRTGEAPGFDFPSFGFGIRGAITEQRDDRTLAIAFQRGIPRIAEEDERDSPGTGDDDSVLAFAELLQNTRNRVRSSQALISHLPAERVQRLRGATGVSPHWCGFGKTRQVAIPKRA